MAEDRPITVRAWLNEARRSLEAQDPEAHHEASILLESVLGIRRSELLIRPDRGLAMEEVEELKRLLAARLDGMPLQYLTRTAPFRNLELVVGPGVFVPRPETEGLVEVVLRFLRDHPGASVLELCLGSGAILASLLSENPTLHGTGVELSPAALRFAEENIARSGVADRARLLAGNLYAPLPAGARFRAIVANPPYIPDEQWEKLPRDVRDFEPPAALLGGPDGTDLIGEIIAEAPRRLEPGGLLAMEIDVSHTERVREMMTETGALRDIRIEKDLAGRLRYATGFSSGGG